MILVIAIFFYILQGAFSLDCISCVRFECKYPEVCQEVTDFVFENTEKELILNREYCSNSSTPNILVSLNSRNRCLVTIATVTTYLIPGGLEIDTTAYLQGVEIKGKLRSLGGRNFKECYEYRVSAKGKKYYHLLTLPVCPSLTCNNADLCNNVSLLANSDAILDKLPTGNVHYRHNSQYFTNNHMLSPKKSFWNKWESEVYMVLAAIFFLGFMTMCVIYFKLKRNQANYQMNNVSGVFYKNTSESQVSSKDNENAVIVSVQEVPDNNATSMDSFRELMNKIKPQQV